jgi:serine O-acetyltransferase
MLYWHLTYKYGIWVDFNADIGPGFYIGHFGGIFISEEVKIGRNCNISQGIVIGKRNRGEKKGCPVLGDKVYVGAGAKIIGKIKIGNNVAIGVNSVVVDDIPDNSVVVGIPGKVISSKGSEDYVDNLI